MESIQHHSSLSKVESRRNSHRPLMATDSVYATLTHRNVEVATILLTGAHTLQQVVDILKRKAPSCSGLVTVFVRNCTRRWNVEYPMYIDRPTSNHPLCNPHTLTVS